MRHLKLQPITAAAFAPFGELITAPPTAPRVNFVAPVENRRATARANIAVVHPPVTTLPTRVETMERHPHSTQAFFPLGGCAYLLLVAPGGDAGPELDGAMAFEVPGHVGISYATGTWHMGMTTLGRASIMALLVHEDGSADDTDTRDIAAIEIGLT